MSENQTCQCEGDCICDELNAFLSDAQSTVVARAVKMELDMFDVGIGRALVDGESIVNLMVHAPGDYQDDDPTMLTMSFSKMETLKLITLLIRGYEENWPDDDYDA
jgi:hypothetical protein